MIDPKGLGPETTWPNEGVPPVLQSMKAEGLHCFGCYREPAQRDPLRVIVTIDDYRDPAVGVWLHLSISRQTRIPSWDDLVRVRDAMGYAEFLFVQVLAPRSFWLNVHDYCMHLQSRLDRETLPRRLWDQHGSDGSRYGRHR